MAQVNFRKASASKKGSNDMWFHVRISLSPLVANCMLARLAATSISAYLRKVKEVIMGWKYVVPSASDVACGARTRIKKAFPAWVSENWAAS